jgi:pyruvate/2-oxoglutarate dehydrogenase complex dihydrolipoamide dehydrogenase (E3) component
MTRVGRAVEKGETQGFMKVLVDADSRNILGAAILGTAVALETASTASR